MDIFASTSFASLRAVKIVTERFYNTTEELDVPTVGDWVRQDPDYEDIAWDDRLTGFRIQTDLNVLQRQLPPKGWFFPERREALLRAMPDGVQQVVDKAYLGFAQQLGDSCRCDSAAELLGQLLVDPTQLDPAGQDWGALLRYWQAVVDFLRAIYPVLMPTALGALLVRRQLYAELKAQGYRRRWVLENQVPNEVCEGLQARYEELLYKLRNTQPAKLLKDQFPRWEQLTELFGWDKTAVFVRVQGLLWRNINALMGILENVQTDYLSHTAAYLDLDESALVGLPYSLFLTAEQWAFARAYKEENGHWPLFFLLYHYLLSHEMDEERAACLAQVYGLRDGVSRTDTEVAEQLGLTAYRVRLYMEDQTIHPPFVCDPADYPELVRQPLVWEHCPEWQRIVESEQLPQRFNGAVALLGVTGWFYGIQRLGAALAINSSVGWECVFGAMREEKEWHREYGRFVHPHGIIQRLTQDRAEQDHLVQVWNAFAGLDIQQDLPEDDLLVLDHVRYIYRDLVVSVLREHGAPMTHAKIRQGLVDRAPYVTVPEDVRPFISMSNQISNLSREGTYRLLAWPNFSQSPVRDKALQCLIEQKDRVHVSAIIAYLWKNGIKSSKSSVLNALRGDNTGLIVDLGKEYFQYKG